MLPSDLNGKDVIAAGAVNLGTVSGIAFDPSTWDVTHVLIKLSEKSIETFGYQKRMLGGVAVRLPTAAIDAVADVVALNKSVDELKTLLVKQT
jgi:sporulation protein YlmC with PRC-barrel domain